MDTPRTPETKRKYKYEGLNPDWVTANDIEDIYFRFLPVNISSYFSKYEDIRSPVKERKKKIRSTYFVFKPVSRKLNLDI